MLVACAFAFSLAASALGGPALLRDDPTPPTFPEAYTASGFILLPYASLREPFSANFDAKQNKSRIDYYNGTMKTFQINAPYTESPQGANFKIVWSPNAETHVPENVCYQANASDAAPAQPQSVFPDLSDFKYDGKEFCALNSASPKDVKNGICSKWTLVTTVLGRKNFYTFLALKRNSTYTPVRYTMLGFDSLIGSHYDQYELIYTAFTPGAQDSSVFDVVNVAPAKKCVAYPDGSGLTLTHLFNPMKALVHRDESHLDEYFNNFKKLHSKAYRNAEEEALRRNNFRHNQRYIDSMNRKNKNFKLKINHLTDLHQDELKFLRGKRYSAGYNGGSAFPAEDFIVRDLPDSVDWRRKGVVSQVKDQAICGSCWSFGTTGHLEAQYALKFGKKVRFAEQQLVDCSWNYGNGACDGGEDFQAYRYIQKYGLSVDEEYGRYLGIDGKCHDGPELKRELPTLLGYVNVTGVDNLKKAVAFIGPISVGIDAAHQSFSFYSHGIFEDKDCKNRPQDLDHAVLAVGYGVSDGGEAYWIVKNSWSTHWGDQGYIKMAVKDNMCGVATAATYALLPNM